MQRTIAGQVRTFICLRCDSSLQVLALFIVLANHICHGCAQVLADAYAAWIGISSITMFPTPSFRLHHVASSLSDCRSVPPIHASTSLNRCRPRGAMAALSRMFTCLPYERVSFYSFGSFVFLPGSQPFNRASIWPVMLKWRLFPRRL
ncbi:hypothetical protein DFH09DRAFT_1196267 [Mycena vulgaris]|nr:hypothetical protein DFH09DRAFT_1196267 [Mycena vulgaris]